MFSGFVGKMIFPVLAEKYVFRFRWVNAFFRFRRENVFFRFSRENCFSSFDEKMLFTVLAGKCFLGGGGGLAGISVFGF